MKIEWQEKIVLDFRNFFLTFSLVSATVNAVN